MSNELFVCRKFIPVTRNEKCNCSLVNLMPFFEYTEGKSWSELVHIVAGGNISTLASYMEENKRLRIVDKHGNGPLHLSIIFKKVDVFDYLMNVDNVNINALNRYGQTSLHLAVITDSEYVMMELIKRGADVNLSDETCCTSLHCAASRESPKMCEILLKHGAEIDFRNLLGKSPIYHACQYGSPDTLYMLLYYGANVTITDVHGILPFTVAMQQSLNCGDVIPQTHQEMHEVLFNYTFEKKKICVNLSTLTVAMKIKSPLFLEILKKTSEVKYARNDLVDLCRNAIVINPSYFMWLMRKFPYVIRDMLVGPIDLHHKLTLGENVDNMAVKLMEFLTMLFTHRRAFNFVEGSERFGYLIPTLVGLYKEGKISMNSLSQLVYFLYSYGLPLELNHLITIYQKCGYCELFKSLLDMDITITYERPQTMMPYLICDINMTLDKFLNQVARPCKQYRPSLRFFSTPRLHGLFATDYRIRKKLKRLPSLPSLKELSRDVARRHIINAFKIKKTKDFYRLLKRIPINDVYKQILTYERPIYRF